MCLYGLFLWQIFSFTLIYKVFTIALLAWMTPYLTCLKCKASGCCSPLNKALCWKSMHRTGVLSRRARAGFSFFFGSSLSDSVQLLTRRVKGCTRRHSPDLPCPQVFQQPLFFFVHFPQVLSTSPTLDCPNIDSLQHSKPLPEGQTTFALRRPECLLQSMPLGRRKRGWECSLASDGFYLTETIFHPTKFSTEQFC